MSTGHPYVKNEKFRKSCPISIYDVAAVETWLEDLARKGENPVCFTGSRVDLLLDEPWECRFRLQPLQRWKEALDPERVEAYRSMGWRLVGQLGPFWVWRCDDPNAPELDTDPVVQGEGYRYLKRRMIFRTVGGGLIWLAMTAYFILAVALSAASLENILRNASWLGFVAAPLVAAALLTILGVQLWLDARNTWRLWKTLTAGVPLERPKPYRRQLRLGQLAWGAALVISVLNLVVSIQNLDGNPSDWDHAARTVYEAGERPPVQMVLADLTALGGLEPLRTEVQEKSLPIAPEMYAARQSAVLPDGEQAFLQTAYYRMLTAGLARTLTAELAENRAGFLDSRPELPLDPIEAPALDGFWWAEEADGIGSPEQFAVLRQGKQVLTLWYTGSADLRTETAYLTSLLEK